MVVWLGSDNCSPNEARPSVIGDAGVFYRLCGVKAPPFMAGDARTQCAARPAVARSHHAQFAGCRWHPHLRYGQVNDRVLGTGETPPAVGGTQ